MKTLKTIINEAKEMPQKVAMAVLQVIANKKSHEDAITMSNADRDKVMEISGEKKLTNDVPGPNTPSSADLDIGLLIAIALNQSTMKQHLWNDDWVIDVPPNGKGGKVKFKNAVGKKTFGQLAKSVGVKL